MELSTYKKGDDVVVVMLTGKLDAHSAEAFRDAYDQQVPEDTERVIIDCGKLESISSLGLGMLMRAQSRIKSRGGQIKFANVSNVIAGVLRVVHLDKVFGMYPTINEAYKDFE